MSTERILDIVTPEGTLDPLAVTFFLPVMLYPQDEQARAERQETMTVQYFSAALYQRYEDNDLKDDQLCRLAMHQRLHAWVQRQADAALNSQQELKRFWQGVVAGAVLIWLMQIDRDAPPASVNKATVALEDHLQGVVPFTDGRYQPKSLREIQKAWSEYKPVVHLWAAVFALRFREKNPSAFDADMLRSFFTESLPEFLAAAEYFLRFGANFYSHGQRKPLLTRSEVWHLPQGFSLPPFDITLPPLADQTIKILQKYCAPIRP